MERKYKGKLERITRVDYDLDTGSAQTHMVLVKGKMHTHIVFHGSIHDIRGHEVRYIRDSEDGILVREELKDLKTGIVYTSSSEALRRK